ncbi:MAG: hypothetical protein AB3N14_08755 [Flavobacteriaceae bacterium]
MKALATLKNLDSDGCKSIIVRNLSRILDIRIIDIDVKNGLIHFLYNSANTLKAVKNELARLGYPVQKCTSEEPNNVTYDTRTRYESFI